MTEYILNVIHRIRIKLVFFLIKLTDKLYPGFVDLVKKGNQQQFKEDLADLMDFFNCGTEEELRALLKKERENYND